MKKERHLENLTPICQLVTYILLVLSVMFLMYIGVRLFRGVTQMRTEAEHTRATVTYVQNEVFLCEDSRNVSVGEGPEGDMLILPLCSGAYEIRIYLSEGYIREELAKAGAKIDPKNAEKISEAETFSLDMADASLLRITIDGQEALAHLGREEK